MATTCKTGPNYSDGGQKPVMKMKAPVKVSDKACHFQASRNQKIRKRITAFLPGRAGHKSQARDCGHSSIYGICWAPRKGKLQTHHT